MIFRGCLINESSFGSTSLFIIHIFNIFNLLILFVDIATHHLIFWKFLKDILIRLTPNILLHLKLMYPLINLPLLKLLQNLQILLPQLPLNKFPILIRIITKIQQSNPIFIFLIEFPYKIFQLRIITTL